MASWSEIEAEAPELAALAKGFLDANAHKTLATLRRDGSPRISGTEVIFADGELWLGGMFKGVKSLDLQRDPRFALHSASAAPEEWKGDAKLAGTAVEADDATKAAVMKSSGPPGPMHLFRLDITELSTVRHGGDPPDHLVIESWHPGRGVERRERR